MISTRHATRFVQRARFATKPPVPQQAEKTVKPIGDQAKPSDGGVNPFIIISMGLASFGIAVAYDPPIARKNLEKLGMLSFLEPVVLGIEKATASFRPSVKTNEQKKEDKKPSNISTQKINNDKNLIQTKKEEKETSNHQEVKVIQQTDKSKKIIETTTKDVEKNSNSNETETSATTISKVENIDPDEKVKNEAPIQEKNVEDSKSKQKVPKVAPPKSKKMRLPSIGSVLVDDVLGDLETLDREELLYRLNNLSHDMKEHAKWEAMRQHDVWRRAEMETWNKYAEIVQEQRAELVSRHEAAVSQECLRLEKEKVDALNKQELAIAAEDSLAFNQESERIEEYFMLLKQAQEDNIAAETSIRRAELQEAANLARLQSAEARLQSLDHLSKTMTSLKSSFELQDKIKKDALEGHREASHSLLGYSHTAAPLVPQLQQDFKTVFAAGVKASMIPRGLEESGFGQLIGSVLGTVLLYAPEISPSSVDGSTRMMIGARNAVQSGDLKAAIQSLDELHGPARLVVGDWVRDAQRRVQSDQALVDLAHTQK